MYQEKYSNVNQILKVCVKSFINVQYIVKYKLI